MFAGKPNMERMSVWSMKCAPLRPSLLRHRRTKSEIGCTRSLQLQCELAVDPQFDGLCTILPAAGSSRGMRTMGKMDASIQGWYIDPQEISICKRPEDGQDWLLGTGSYGKASLHACNCILCFNYEF